MTLADPVIAIEDAIGADYYELAPPGEAHLDPFSVGTLLACCIVYAVGAGVKDGIQEAAKDITVSVLRACGRRVSERLTPERFYGIFTGPDRQAQQPAAREQAAKSLAEAAAAASTLDPAVVAQLASVVATAVADAATTAGLKNSGTQRLAQTVEAQVKITFTPAD
jgi:hypothetical protein